MSFKKQIANIAILLVMIAASVAAHALRPTDRISDDGERVNLEQLIPLEFAGWKQLDTGSAGVVNPQQQAVINMIYSQTLSRTYVNSKGEYIMLSIAYGENQSDANQVHLPDVCYPAQGFQLRDSEKTAINTDFGKIDVKRLFTVMGIRQEPLTYWTTVGNKIAIGGYQTKMAQLSYGFAGKIPDGLIFRVSTISGDTAEAYGLQEVFIKDLLANLTPQQRHRLAGLDT